MNMTPRFRKFALFAHITFSIGWIGAILPYLALAIAGIINRDAQLTRAVILSMELIGWYVLVPFSFAALLSGLVQALGTQWGLLRHWWILAKLLLTIFATVVLWQHMLDVSRLARTAKEMIPSNTTLRPELIHASGGLLVLLIVMAISWVRPWGMTPYGRVRASEAGLLSRASAEATSSNAPALVAGKPRWKRVVWIHAAHAIAIAMVFATVLHITGMHHH